MLKQALAIGSRELTFMWRDRVLRNIMLVTTLLSLFLFWGVYQAQIIKEIPTAVVDLDHTKASRELDQKIANAEYLKVVAHPLTYDGLQEIINQGQVIVGVVIPENYGKQVALHRQTRVLLVVDGSNMIYATNASSAVLTVTRTISAEAGIQTLVARGIQPGQALDAYQSVSFQEEPWFNPTLNYAYFLVLALVLNMWQQCCTLASCMNVIGETGVKSWYQVKASGVSRFRYFFCKSLVQILVFLAIALAVYLLAFWVFKLPLHGSFLLLFLFTVIFAVSLHSIGTLMSSFARNSVDASRFGMIIALPSFVLSGYTWPIEAMPGWLQPLVKLLPQTWFFQGLNFFTFKEAGWGFAAHYFLALAAIALVCYTGAAIFISRS